MDPSEIRKTILDEHDEMRRQLLELGRALKQAMTDLNELKSLTKSLLERLTAHTQREDRILVPALREADMWGPARAEQLTRHHVEQRQTLTELLHRLESEDIGADELQTIAQGIIKELRDDMNFEEKNYLRETILRDDVVSIGMEDG